jgi:hypothetical protein
VYGGSSSSISLDLIPVGTYTVRLSLYNSAVSSSTPQVTGTASGVVITKGGMTTAAITCLPTNPSAISVSDSKALSLDSWAEQWYSLAVVSGTAYYFTLDNANYRFALFDGSGSYISSASDYLTYTPTDAGSLYIAIVNNSGSTSSATFAVPTTAPVLNEGSVSSPVALTLNSSHSFKVGSYSSGQSVSYYSFTTTSSGDYAINMPTNTNSYTASLYSSSDFSTTVVDPDSYYDSYGRRFSGLAAGTTYYLELVGNSGSSLNASGTIMDSAAIAAAAKSSEVSKSSPQGLTLGSGHAAGVGYLGYDSSSYYSFTTGAGVDYSLTLSGLGSSAWLSAAFFSDSSFSSQATASYQFSSSSTSASLTLKASTTYYLRISNSGASAFSYTLTIAAAAEPAINALPIVSTDSWTTGTLASSSDAAWYSADVTSGMSYTLYLDNANGSGTYTTYSYAGIYLTDRATLDYSYLSNIYSSGCSFTATSSKVYILVTGISAGGFALKLMQN